MKLISTSVLSLALLASIMGPTAYSQTASGPRSESISSLDLVTTYNKIVREQNPNAAHFNADFDIALKSVAFHQDITNLKTFYYVLPLSMRKGPQGQEWSETLNSLVFKTIEQIDRLSRENANKVSGFAVNDMTASRGRDALLSPTPIETGSTPLDDNAPVTTEDVHNAVLKVTSGLSDADKAKFVEFVKINLPRLGRIASASLNYDTATHEFASLVKTLAVLDIDIPVGFGLDPQTTAAFTELRRVLEPKGYVFAQLGSAPTWTLSKEGIASNSSPTNTVANDVFMPTINVDSEIFQNFGSTNTYQIGSAGGTINLKLGYAGAIAYGYGDLDSSPTNALEKDARLNLAKYLPGMLSQELSRNTSFKGYAECRFKAEVSLDYAVTLEKRTVGMVLPVASNRLVDSAVAETPEINECVVYDDAGNPANTQNPEIAKMVESFKKQHIDRNLSVYKASLSTRATLLKNAKEKENGWKYLPMPKESKLVTNWSSTRECEQVRTNQYCAEVTTKKFLGIKVKESCTRWDWNHEERCSTQWEATDSFVKVDVPVAYFESAAQYYDAWNKTDRIDFQNAEPVKLRIQTGGQLCFERKPILSGGHVVGFSRNRCAGQEQRAAALDTIDDLPPSNLPENAPGSLEILPGDTVLNW